MAYLLELRGVTKEYAFGDRTVRVLDAIDLAIDRHSLVVVTGPSGSGKSTLLNIMGGLDRPTCGSVLLEGQDLATMRERELTHVRRRRLGFVFQFFNLLPNLAAWQNVAMPLLLDGAPPAVARHAALRIGDELGLGDLMRRPVANLSGGEMQRVAVARALVHEPGLVLADEPTGNLDSVNGSKVLALLRESVRRRGATLVMVTHDSSMQPLADRVVRLRDGRIDDG